MAIQLLQRCVCIVTSAEYGHFVFCVLKQPTLFTFQFINTCCGALVCCHAPVKTFEGTGQVASIAAMAYQCCKIIKTGCCELCLLDMTKLHGNPAFVKMRLHLDFCGIRAFCPLRVEATDPVYIPIRKHLLWCFSLLPCSSQNVRRNRAGRFDCCHGVSMLQNKQWQICIVTSAETDILLWLVEWCH